MRPMPGRVFERNYVLAQSFGCYFASFVYLLGYNLAFKDGGCTPLLGYVSLLISMGLLLMAVIFMVAAFFESPPTWANRALNIMDFPIYVATVGGAAVALIQGINLVSHGSILFNFVFYAGFLFYIAIPLQIVFRIVQRFRSRQVSA